MKKGITILLVAASLVVSFLLNPIFAENQDTADINVKDIVDITLIMGYQTGDLIFSIAGNDAGSDPNVLSELEYNDLKIFQYGVDIKATLKHAYIRGELYFGNIVDGESIDSDYGSDNRNDLWAKSVAKVKDDGVYGFNLCFGYQFAMLNKRLNIAPLIGYSYHAQDMRVTDGVWTEAAPSPYWGYEDNATDVTLPEPGTELPGLDSTYDAEWKGVWTGADISLELFRNFFITSSLEFHLVEYEATADWNLRDDLAHPVSFIQESDGTGTAVRAGICYVFGNHINLGLEGSLEEWSTDEGTDVTYSSEGFTGTTQLNEVKWKSKSISLTFNYKF